MPYAESKELTFTYEYHQYIDCKTWSFLRQQEKTIAYFLKRGTITRGHRFLFFVAIPSFFAILQEYDVLQNSLLLPGVLYQYGDASVSFEHAYSLRLIFSRLRILRLRAHGSYVLCIFRQGTL